MSAAFARAGLLVAAHSVNKSDYKLAIKNLRKMLLAAAFRLFESQEGLDVLLVHTRDQCEMVEVTLLLLGLFGQNVAVVSVFSFDFS